MIEINDNLFIKILADNVSKDEVPQQSHMILGVYTSSSPQLISVALAHR